MDHETITDTTAPATLAASDLRAAADWLASHPDLPEVYAVHRYDGGAEITFRTTDADERAVLVSLTGDGYHRWVSEYDDPDDPLVSITTTEIAPRFKVTVVLSQPEVTC